MPRHTTLGVVLGLFLASTGCTAVDGSQSPELDESEIKADGKMFVSQRGDLNQVSVFTRAGKRSKLVGVMTGDGLVSPLGVTTSGRNIYVVSQGNNAVYAHVHRGGEHDCTKYKLTQIVESGAGGLTNPFYIIEHDGLLYVSSHDTDEILTYDAEDGTFMGVAVEAGTGGLSGPRGLKFGPDGNLYVSSSKSNQVLVFDPSGAFSHVLASDIPVPCGLDIGPRGDICVGVSGGGGVRCYDDAGELTYEDPDGKVCGLGFGPRGELYTTRPDLNTVEKHSLEGGEGETFAETPFVVALGWGLR